MVKSENLKTKKSSAIFSKIRIVLTLSFFFGTIIYIVINYEEYWNQILINFHFKKEKNSTGISGYVKENHELVDFFINGIKNFFENCYNWIINLFTDENGHFTLLKLFGLVINGLANIIAWVSMFFIIIVSFFVLCYCVFSTSNKKNIKTGIRFFRDLLYKKITHPIFQFLNFLWISFKKIVYDSRRTIVIIFFCVLMLKHKVSYLSSGIVDMYAQCINNFIEPKNASTKGLGTFFQFVPAIIIIYIKIWQVFPMINWIVIPLVLLSIDKTFARQKNIRNIKDLDKFMRRPEI